MNIQHQLIQLSTEESEAFVAALLNPAQPNNNLKLATLKYQQLISESQFKQDPMKLYLSMRSIEGL